MTDLKTDFQKWLIQQGYKEGTDKGRPSTIYEYCKRIDRLCDKLYGNSSTDKWEILAINIGKILISCYECCNKEYYIDQYNAKDALLYFNDIKHNCIDNDLFRASVNLVYNANKSLISEASFSQIDDYLKIFDFCLEQMTNDTFQDINIILGFYCISNPGSSNLVSNFLAAYSQGQCPSFSEISIHIQYNNHGNTKTKSALMWYYEFLQVESDSPIVAKLKDERDDNKIKLCIAKVEKALDDLMKCITDTHKTGKTALQIKSHRPDGTLGKLETASVLEIDYKTLRALENKGILIPNKITGFYNEKDINEYLQHHFHKAEERYPDVDYSQKNDDSWCNRKKAAKIMNRSEHTIYNYTKKGLLTYTDYAPQAPRYYKPELEYLAIHL